MMSRFVRFGRCRDQSVNEREVRKALERKGVITTPTAAPAQDELEQYYTPEDVARLFRVSIQTIKLLMQDEAEGVNR